MTNPSGFRLAPAILALVLATSCAGITEPPSKPDLVLITVDSLRADRPGYAGGVGCALHIAALDAGERPLEWKPEVCWQVPLRLEHSTDEAGHLTSLLREWKRRDWGVGCTDFGWWWLAREHGRTDYIDRLMVVAQRDSS